MGKNTLSFGHFSIWGEGPPAKIGFDTFFLKIYIPQKLMYINKPIPTTEIIPFTQFETTQKNTTFSRCAKVKKLPKLRAGGEGVDNSQK